MRIPWLIQKDQHFTMDRITIMQKNPFVFLILLKNFHIQQNYTISENVQFQQSMQIINVMLYRHHHKFELLI